MVALRNQAFKIDYQLVAPTLPFMVSFYRVDVIEHLLRNDTIYGHTMMSMKMAGVGRPIWCPNGMLGFATPPY